MAGPDGGGGAPLQVNNNHNGGTILFSTTCSITSLRLQAFSNSFTLYNEKFVKEFGDRGYLRTILRLTYYRGNAANIQKR